MLLNPLVDNHVNFVPAKKTFLPTGFHSIALIIQTFKA